MKAAVGRELDRGACGHQAVVSAPGFSLGVACDEHEIHRIVFLAPTAELAPRNALAAAAAEQLAAYLANAEYAFTLPLRPSGSSFQRRVWQEIAAIAVHRTRSYGELARLLHSAPRAVGQACAANPYPVVVPCHRVLAADGRLGGFAGHTDGFLLDVKRWLLAHEGC